MLGGGIDLVHAEPRLAAVDGAVAGDGLHGAHARLQVDIDGDGLRAGGEDVVELTVEDLDEVGGVARERMVAVAGARQLQHQVLVVAEPQPDGADGDALREKHRAKPCEILHARRADIGPAVGQQHDAIEALEVLVRQHLVAAAQNALVDGGGAAGADALDSVGEEARVGHPLRGNEDVGAMVEHHHGSDVVRPQPADREAGGFAGLGDARAAHGTGAIDDEGDVDRRTVSRRLGLAALDRNLQVVLVRDALLHDRLGETRIERNGPVRASRRRCNHAGERRSDRPQCAI